jgi:hypothetical protein
MSGLLTYSPADMVRRLLVALGQGTLPVSETTWPIYASNEPDTPDNCITVYDTAGKTNGRVHNTGEVQEHHGIMIRIRAVDFTTGWSKAGLISNCIDTSVLNNSLSLDGKTFIIYSITRTGNVLSIGKESPTSRRNLFSLNAVVALRQTN